MRKGLAVVEGCTDGDGIAAQFVASIVSRSTLIIWFDGEMVGQDTSDDSDMDLSGRFKI